jgi:hypothetical protein
MPKKYFIFGGVHWTIFSRRMLARPDKNEPATLRRQCHA